MSASRLQSVSLFLSVTFTLFAHAQPAYDSELTAISPQAEVLSVGLAGEDPANIGRYLLARGAESAQISPSGGVVAFRYSATGLPQLWIAESKQQARQLTFGNGITFFRWLPDGNSLIYGVDNDGNELESYYQISADGEKETLILPSVPGGFRIFGDVSSNSDFIVYSSSERNGLDFDIYRKDLLTGSSVMLHEGSYGQIARALSPDSKSLLVTETVGEDANNLYVLDIDTGELTNILSPLPRAQVSSRDTFAWTSDSTGFYAVTNADREYTALVYFELGFGGYKIIEAPETDAGNVWLCGNDRYLAWTTNTEGYFDLFVRDLETSETLTTPDIPQGVHRISCNNQTSELAILTNGWRTPGDIRLWDIASGEIHSVFSSNLAGLDADRLIPPQSVRMTARDGVELQGLLYLPPDIRSGRTNKPPPVLFEVHGGPVSQAMATFDPVAQYHVDRGVSVFKPNVRGSSGFGRTYMTLDDQERRLDSVRDLIDMLDYFAKDGRVDVTRAAVSGGSYGGYMVNAVLAVYPGRFKVGVSRYGVADWVTALEIASPMLKASDLIEYGDISTPKWRRFYEENSPINQANRITVPVLFSHGINDPRVNIAETETMVKTLRSNGIDAPYIRFPDEGHGWRKLSNRLFYFRREAEFLSATLEEDEPF
jgi:dipeptidyl aminopeptidase/acylaminoacyl peptidase